MYASSIFGWLRFLERRTGKLRNEPFISESPLAEPHTEACREGVLELSDLLEPLLSSVVVIKNELIESGSPMRTVLDELRAEGPLQMSDIPTDVAPQIETSTRLEVVDNYVVVLIDTVDYGVNIPPVLSLVVDWLEDLVELVTDIIKFVKADNHPGSEWLLLRWKQIGGMLCDLHTGCRRLLDQVHRQHRINDVVSTYVDGTESMSKKQGEEL